MVLRNLSDDSTISTKKATQIKSHIEQISGWELTGDDLTKADLNNDGVVDKKDIQFYADYLAGKNPETVYFDPTEIKGTFIGTSKNYKCRIEHALITKFIGYKNNAYVCPVFVFSTVNAYPVICMVFRPRACYFLYRKLSTC